MQDMPSTTTAQQKINGIAIEDYHIESEPFYVSTGDEISLFESAYRLKMPVLLKGPTGCGKTRFLEHMAWKLNRPLVTIACHEDLTASDLVGRYLNHRLLSNFPIRDLCFNHFAQSIYPILQ